MKILFIGGQKSGKSTLAEVRSIELAAKKPYYLATSEIMDEEFATRVKLHKKQRADRFITIEEPLNIYKKISECDDLVLVECLTLWINNMLYHQKESAIFTEIEKILALPQNTIFVLNDVGLGVIPNSKLARKFVDISGKVGQIIAKSCDEVYYTTVGIGQRIK